jgi:hypothetical protein
MELKGYRRAPMSVQEEVIADRKAQKEGKMAGAR